MDFPGGSDGKESACNVGGPGSIPGLGRSPGGGHGNPLQYSCLTKEFPWTEESGRLLSMGSQRVVHSCVTKPSAAAFIYMNVTLYQIKPLHQPAIQLLAFHYQ